MTKEEVESCIECLKDQIHIECNDAYDRFVEHLGCSWDVDRRLSFSAGMDFALKIVGKNRALHTLFKV